MKSRIPRLGRPLALGLVCFASTPLALAQSAARPAAPGSGLARLSDLQALAERVRPSIVQVLVIGYAPGREGGALLSIQRGGGSGGKRSAVLQVEREGVLRYVAVPVE